MLSARLEAIASLVEAGSRPIDIGCDHAYLPIELVAAGICPEAVVTDISPGAIARAEDNIAAAHLQDRIKARCADGLDGYERGEADLLIISGMGGPLMIDILEKHEDLLADFRQMILSPQSEVPVVRRWLKEHGYKLAAERMVRDQDKYYVILKAAPGAEDAYAADEQTQAAQYAYGPLLIRERDSVLADFLEQETGRLDEAIAAAGQSNEARARRREQELRAQKEAACSVMKSWTI